MLLNTSKTILSRFAYVPRKEVPVEALRRELTICSKFGGDAVPLYDDRHPDFFGLPVFYDSGNGGARVADRRVVTPSINLKFTSTLWPGQPEILEKFTSRVHSGMSGFILEAKPGFGKTVTVIAMLSVLQQRTLVVVPRSNLIRQWVERLKEHSNLTTADIGWVEGGRADWQNKKVVVGLVHSVVLDRYGKDFRKYFGCVVFDEVDRSVPPATFASAVSMFPAKYRIGASATVKRQDGLDVVFRLHIGQSWLRGDDANRMAPKVVIRNYRRTSGPIPSYLTEIVQRRGTLLSLLAKNEDRNRVLAGAIKELVETGRRCLVLSDRIQQLISLKNILLSMDPKREYLKDSDIGFYVRSLPWKTMTPKDLSKVAQHCKVLLGTYGMIALGTDIPSLAGLIYATPQSQIEQSKGRIERLLVGKQQPVIVDVVDTEYAETVRWGQFRFREYQRQGLEVNRL